MNYYYSDIPGNYTDVFMAVFGVMLAVMGIICLVIFLFGAVGNYTLSKNRGYPYPWLSFIPIAGSWVLGGIADNINACNGKQTHYRLIVTICSAVSTLAAIIVIIFTLIQMPNMLLASYMELDSAVVEFITQITLFSSLLSIVSILNRVFLLICEYTIYQDYCPNQSVLFLLLSIFLGIDNFFLFAIRNKPSRSIYNQNANKTAAPIPNVPPPFVP